MSKTHRQRPLRPSKMGWLGKFKGATTRMPVPPEWRGTTKQVCGLWPFVAGTGTPVIGVPLGTHLMTNSAVCFDPISWFMRARLISNPSAFVMSMPGLGKSTTVRRMIVGLEGYGVHSMVLGDLKPDYVRLIEALDGQVISIGRGRGSLNPLDMGDISRHLDRLPQDVGHRLMAEAHGRQLTMLMSLIQLSRGSRPTDREETIVSAVLSILGDTLDRPPVIADVLRVIQNPPATVRDQALDRGDISRYHQITEDLEASLMAMIQGVFGEVFASPTTTQMRMDRSVVFDLSSIDETDHSLEAAALLTCWSYGFAQVDLAHTLADYGLAPRQHYLLVEDEVWRAMRAGEGMVDRIDAVTRLNRAKGVGNIMITHTMKDFESLPLPEDRMKARGFIERAGALLIGGIPMAEMSLLDPVTSLSTAEKTLISSWSTPAGWDEKRGMEATAPGAGKFLIKVGRRPGIPTQVRLTSAEAVVNDTNERWH